MTRGRWWFRLWTGERLAPRACPEEAVIKLGPGSRYRFDYDYNTFGTPKGDSAVSPEYTLKILDQ